MSPKPLSAVPLPAKKAGGVHYRSDFPEPNSSEFLCNFTLTHSRPIPERQEVVMGRMAPEGQVA